MRVERRLVAVAAGLLLGAAGCSGPAEPAPSPTTSTPTATQSPSPTPSPSPMTETERAAANAEALIREYYRVTDAVAKDPANLLDQLGPVTTSTNLTTQQTEYRQWQQDGLRQTGDTRIAELVVQTVSLDNSDPAKGVVPTVQVDVCYDVSDVDVVRDDGTSVVGPERPDRAWERLWVANYDYANDPDGAWRVASGQTLEQEPCAGH